MVAPPSTAALYWTAAQKKVIRRQSALWPMGSATKRTRWMGGALPTKAFRDRSGNRGGDGNFFGLPDDN